MEAMITVTDPEKWLLISNGYKDALFKDKKATKVLKWLANDNAKLERFIRIFLR